MGAKKRRPTKEELRDAWRGIPKVRHFSDCKVPSELVSEFKRASRDVVLHLPGSLRKDLAPHTLCQNAYDKFVRRIVDSLNMSILRKHCPPASFRVGCSTLGQIYVEWHTLDTISSPNGLVRFDPSRPTIRINGGEYVAGFTKHSIDQTLARLGAEDPSPAILASLAAIFELSNGVTVEPAGDHGYWMWVDCRSGYVTELIARMLTRLPPDRCQFRLAFYPVKFWSKFAVAQTALVPWFYINDFPEHNDLVRGLDHELLQLDRISSLAPETTSELKKLHERLPMVRPMPRAEKFNYQAGGEFEVKAV